MDVKNAALPMQGATNFKKQMLYTTSFMALLFSALFDKVNQLFIGIDGQYVLHNILLHSKWATLPFAGTWNPEQLTSPFFYLQDIYAIPCLYYFFLSSISLYWQVLLCYLTLSVQMYAILVFLLRSLDVSIAKSHIMSAISIFCLVPTFYPGSVLGPFFTSSPFLMHGVSLSILLNTIFFRMRYSIIPHRFTYIWYFVVIFALTNSSVFAATLTTPSILVAHILLLYSSYKTPAFPRLLWCIFVAFILLLASGSIIWPIHQILYSARHAFNKEILDTKPTLFLTSILFCKGSYQLVLVPMAFVGTLFLRWTTSAKLRLAAQYLGIMLIATCALGLLYNFTTLDMRKLPRPLYLEFTIIPFYPLCASYALYCIFKRLSFYPKLGFSLSCFRYFPVIILTLAGFLFILADNRMTSQKMAALGYAKPTAVTDKLQSIRLSPGSIFRGRVYSYTWPGLQTDAELIKDHPEEIFYGKNPNVFPSTSHHNFFDLIAFDIPMVEAIDACLTTPFYLVASRTVEGSHPWWFNCACITRLDLRFLRMIGVKYVVLPRQHQINGLSLVAYIVDTPKFPRRSYQQLSVGSTHLSPPPDFEGIFLYELDDINTGNYSPTHILQAHSFSDALSIMANNDLSFKESVVLFDSPRISGPLVPAGHVEVRIDPGALRVLATSTGTSMILLPFQYTNSMRWIPEPGHHSDVTVLRANGFLTGLFFSGEINGSLVISTESLNGRSVVINDYLSMRDLGAFSCARNALSYSRRYGE